VWGIEDPGTVFAPNSKMLRKSQKTIRTWATGLTQEERDLAYSWLLVSIGQYEKACIELVGKNGRGGLLARSKSNRQIHMLAALFAGYAKRELSDHNDAHKYLRIALEESKDYDLCRHAQAAHKLGESLSAFESVRFWYFWPTVPAIHPGARWLLKAIEEYTSISAEELAAKQLGRAGLGAALMNLGQLYRRTAAYTPYIRSRLAKQARKTISNALNILMDEKDLRVIPMAQAALAADDPSMTIDEKLKQIDSAIEYAEAWNQDYIQIGSAYFIKGQVLARVNPQASEACYLKALSVFRDAGMKAEIARTKIELAASAAYTINKMQGSREWKFGSSMLAISKLILCLTPVKPIIFLVLIFLIGLFILSLIL